MTQVRQGFINKVRILAKLFRDPATPLRVKILMIVCIIYVVSPIDAIPDIVPIPLVGLIDDILLVGAVTYGLASTDQGKKWSSKLKKPGDKTIVEGK